MATFDEHLQQAKKNIILLEHLNSASESFSDWQITACFYIAVHLANAHIAATENKHYRTHHQVLASLNPFNSSPSNIDQDAYVAFERLRDLSRRSRYLVSDKDTNKEENAFWINDRHLAKAFRHLNTFMQSFQVRYSITIPKIRIARGLVSASESLQSFEILSASSISNR